MAYAKARKDFEYLETIAELDDWVEIDGQVRDLMENPSKKKAEELYSACIGLWMQEAHMRKRELTKRAKTIRERYYC
ncbi:hypothetical protein EV128_12218 [Rhizobium azibense]|nr:hypothetical protein EV128_12218 [Rhizobium azibense]